MKTLYLVRHGKAEERNTDKPDYKRELIERGENDVLRVAERVHEKGVVPSLIISSPAPRALATAKMFAQQLHYPTNKIRSRKVIYNQPDGTLLGIVHTIDDLYENVMLVGHDPAMTNFAWFLTDDFEEYLPTSSIVGISFDTDAWREVNEGIGTLIFFYSPEQIKRETTITKKNLENKLTEQISTLLMELDTEAAEQMKKALKKSSKKIVKKFVKILSKVRS